MKRQKDRTLFRRAVSFSAAALLITVQVLTASVCYADDLTYKTARETTLYIAIPKTWQIEEIGDLDEDAEMVLNGEDTYQVLELQGAEDEQRGRLWVCADPGNLEFYYNDTVTEAKDYYDESGDSALDTVIETAFPDAETWGRENTAYIKGENKTTFVIREDLTVDGEEYLIYLTCDFTQNGGVHEALIFEGAGYRDLCDSIAESIEGYGYATALIDDRVYPSYDDSTDEPDYMYYGDNETSHDLLAKIMKGVVWIIMMIFLLSVLGRMVKSNKLKKRFSNETVDKWTAKEERKGRCKHPDMHVVQEGTKYSGYFESLKTLHKSGLLTTKEMNQLLEKHKDDI